MTRTGDAASDADVELTTAALLRTVGGLLKAIATVSAASMALWKVGVWLVWPHVENVLEVHEAALRTSIEASVLGTLTSTLEPINASLARLTGYTSPPFVEVGPAPLVLGSGPFQAGGTVPLLAFVWRRESCPSTVEVRFISEATGRVDATLSYERPSNRAPVTDAPAPFHVDVQLPEHMPPGSWSYAPIITPDPAFCPGEMPVHVPPSHFFEVG